MATLSANELQKHDYLTGHWYPSPSRGRQTACPNLHYGDVIMNTIASPITSLTIVYSTAYSDADQRKRQSSASLAFARGLHRGPVNFPHKGPVTRKMFLFDDVIMVKDITNTELNQLRAFLK